MKLKPLPAPDVLELNLPDGYIGLITDDGSVTTAKLAQALINYGWRVVVLSLPTTLIPQQVPLPTGVNRVVLQEISENHLKQQLLSIAQVYGPIGALIHLHPCFPIGPRQGLAYLEADKDILKQVFFMAKHLKSSLNQAATIGHSCFCTVARLDGAFGLEQKMNFGVVAAGLFGLTKSLNQEWDAVSCRAIDLHPKIEGDDAAQYILAELYDPDRTTVEVGYGSYGRTTLVRQE